MTSTSNMFSEFIFGDPPITIKLSPEVGVVKDDLECDDEVNKFLIGVNNFSEN